MKAEIINQILDGDNVPVARLENVQTLLIGKQGERIPRRCAVSGRILQSGATHIKLQNDFYVAVNPGKILSEERRKVLLALIAPKKPIPKAVYKESE
jgi:hypothetical protein